MKYYKTTEKIYDFCKSYIDEHGYAPTIREIGKGVGLMIHGTRRMKINEEGSKI